MAPFRENPCLSKALFAIDAVPTTIDEQRARQLQDNPEGHRWAVDNAWLSGSAADVVPAMRRAYTTLPNDKSFTIWFSMAPLRRLPDMAFSLQSEIYLASYVVWEDPADDERHRAWLASVMEDLEPVTVGQYLGDSDLSQPSVEVHVRRRLGTPTSDPRESATPTASSSAISPSLRRSERPAPQRQPLGHVAAGSSS